MRTPTVIRDFARHSEHRPEVEPDVIETLVDFKESFFGDPDPARWRADELCELMLEILPRKVTAGEEWFAAVAPTIRAYLDFLSTSKRLARGSDPAPVLLAAVDRIGDGVLAASRDPRNFGMAKSIFSAVGFDPSDPDPGRAMMEAFNALPDDQRAAILDPSMRGFVPGGGVALPLFDDESFDADDDETWPPLRLMWLPPGTQLADLVRSAPLVRSLLRLAAWNGEGHQVTRQGILTPAGAEQACADLGLPLPAEPVKAADRIPALHRLWSLALDNEILAIEQGSAVRGTASDLLENPDQTPDAVVDWWAELFDSCLDWGLDAAEDPDLEDDLDEVVLDHVDQVVTMVLAELYDGHGVPVSGVEELVTAAVEEALLEETDSRAFSHRTETMARQRWAAHLAQLVDLGAVTLEDDIVGLTPLGQAGVRALALADGAEAPVIEDPAALDAESLLENLPGLGPSVVEPLMAAWSAARPAEQAVAELLDAARTGAADTRMTAIVVLTDFFREYVTGPGRSGLEELRDDPVLGLSAHVLLSDPEEGVVLPAHLQQWAAIEAVAMASNAHALDDQDAAALVWEIVDADADLDSAWRCTHPQLIEILEIVAERHPAGRARKAAKKALFKARHPEKTQRAEQSRNREKVRRPGHTR